jgi:hypothetical protein
MKNPHFLYNPTLRLDTYQYPIHTLAEAIPSLALNIIQYNEMFHSQPVSQVS